MSLFLEYPFLLRGLLASLLFGALGGFLSPFIISKRMAMYADSLSHASLTGIILAMIIGFISDGSRSSNPGAFVTLLQKIGIEPVTFVLILTSIIVAILISFIIEKSKLPNDTAIIFFFYTALAIGIFLLGISPHVRSSMLHSFLFGSVLGVSSQDLILLTIIGAFVCLFLLLHIRSFLFSTWNRDLARLHGVRVQLFDYLFLIIIGIVVAFGVRLVGNLLLGALLVIPAAAARNVARSFRGFLALSTTFGFLSGFTGYILASPLVFNTFPGPTIILTSIAFFVATLFVKFFTAVRV